MRRDVLVKALQAELGELATTTLLPVEVAVLDSGIDATHPDLVGRVVSASMVEMEGDVARLVFCPVGQNDAFGHGTAVASVILRVAPNAMLHDVRVLGASNTGTGAGLVAGLNFAVKQKTRVINMSLAATANVGERLVTACERAYYQDQIIVASMRNMPLQDRSLPAELSSCIGVGKRPANHAFAFDYLKENSIEYKAWGMDVTVASPGGGYTTISGTSYATPHITGLCCLFLGAWPDLSPFELKTLLRAHAESELPR